MVLMMAAGLLILGIAFYQTIQGLYSSLIMALLTVLCAVVAFNYYEPLAELLVPRLGAVAYGVSLLALFVAPLLLLREALDRLLPANMLLDAWPDRAGAGVFGLLTAMVLVGMLMIIVWMLPLPGAVLWHQPYDDALQVKDAGPPQWAADFTVGVAGRLSAGPLAPFSQGRRFDRSHANLLLDLYALRNRPDGISVDALPDAMDVTEAYVVGDPNQKAPSLPAPLDRAPRRYPLIEPGVPTKILVVRVRVDQSARDEKTATFVLPATHFRLVATQADGSVEGYYPVGYLTYAGGWRFNTAPDKLDPTKGTVEIGKIIVTRPWQDPGGPAKLYVDWVYRIPAGDTPDKVVFRRAAAAELPTVAVRKELGSPNGSGRDSGVQLALGVKSVQAGAAFAPPAAPSLMFDTEEIVVGSEIPRNPGVPLMDAGRPAVIKRLEYDAGAKRLQALTLDGELAEMGRQFMPPPPIAQGFQVPPGKVLIRLQCRINAQAKMNPPLLQKLEPRLMLSDTSMLTHQGGWLFYDGYKKAYLYYDMNRTAAELEGNFKGVLAANISRGDLLGFCFVAPDNANLAVVKVLYGPAEYDFQLPSPLVCKGK